MKPQGRRYFKSKTAKHHVKIKGKFIAWWEDVCTPNKTREKQAVKKEIKSELDKGLNN